MKTTQKNRILTCLLAGSLLVSLLLTSSGCDVPPGGASDDGTAPGGDPVASDTEAETVPDVAIPEDALIYELVESADAPYAKVTGLSETEGNHLYIPSETPDGVPVRYVGYSAFAGRTEIIRVTVAEGITEILRNAFMDCTSLREVDLPDGLLAIQEQAFAGCTALERVELPRGLTKIDRWAFLDCESLRDITLPDTLTFLGDRAFQNCRSLTHVEIPASLGEGRREFILPSGLFRNCSSLKTVVFPDNLTEIGEVCFEGCESLEKLSLPAGLEKVQQWAFAYCSGLVEVEFAGETSLMGESFRCCTSLSSIKGYSVMLRMRGEGAFYQCPSLTEATVLDSRDFWIDARVNQGDYLSTLEVLHFPDGDMTHTGEKLTASLEFTSNGDGTCTVSGLGSYQKRDVVIPSQAPNGDTVTAIAPKAFYNELFVISVTIPATVTEIGAEAFDYMIPLGSIHYEGTVAEWESIRLGNRWFVNKSEEFRIAVQCTDGEIIP